MEVKYRLFEGDLQASGLKIAVVCSRFNEFFVSKLAPMTPARLPNFAGTILQVEP